MRTFYQFELMRFSFNKILFSAALLSIFSFLFINGNAQANNSANANSTDSLSNTIDSTANTPTKKKNRIESPINYTANDSIVLDMRGDAFLYGEGKVDYGKINLTADYIHMNTDSNMVDAHGNKNADGEVIGEPKLIDNGEEYQAKKLRYNFVTKQGYINHGIVQQGEGYIIGEKTKKIDDEYLCMEDGKYTTCDDHDCPHFYLNLTKAKVKQKKWVVTGPAYLVLLDVPLPIIIPFGYFPFNNSYSSGVIIPSYGDDLDRGFYLTQGGYYFAISDYMDLTLTGDMYTKGTWASYINSTYTKRYKYRGNVNASYREDVTGEKELKNVEGGYSKFKNLAITWTHSQDPKANPYRTFSASVNFSSSGYDRSNIQNYSNPALLSQNTKSSSVSYGYRFPETPFSISANILANQRTADSTISLTAPDFTVTMSRIYPFKRKEAIGKEKWFEKIYMSYNGHISNSIETKENGLLNASFANDWRNGINHSIPIGATFNVLKYLALTPTANYNERWYLQGINQSYNFTTNEVLNDTTNKFARVYDFNVGLSASTKIYGFFIPSRRIFGDQIGKIRHVITPTLSYSFRPDFSDPFWGSWKTYTGATPYDATVRQIAYSPYTRNLFGTSPEGKSSSINFSISNNLEMKWKQHNDTTGEAVYKTVSLIESLSASNNYNFAADSLRWGNFSANLRLKLFAGLNLNLSGTFDTYLYECDSTGKYIYRVNTARWEVGKLPRLINTSTSFSYTVSNQTFKKKEDPNKKEPDNKKDNKQKTVDDDGYTSYQMPWSLSFDYSMNYGYNYSSFDKILKEYDRKLTHNIGMRGNLSLTSKWSFNFGASYDFEFKQLAYSTLGVQRNLHCWGMSANIVPFGPYKSYNFLLNVNSSLLSDLKYDKQSDYTTPINWY